jgi:ABC-2 type transport system permease protein
MNPSLHPSLRRIRVVARKELLHILRDPQTLVIVILMPVIMMFLYGYALNADIREARVALEGAASSAAGRDLAARLDASPFFEVTGTIPPSAEPLEIFREHPVRALLRLPPRLDADLRRPGGADVQIMVDGSDPGTGNQMRAATEAAVRGILFDHLALEPPRLLDARAVILYNPEQRSALFFVPGLMAVILLMISALLTSIAITREKETGTLGQLLITPLRPREIMAGKLLPYVVLACVDGLLILTVGWLAFGVRLAGDPLFLAAASLVYVFTALCIGLLISTIAKRQHHAMLMALGATLMPTVILSGFIFPVSGMPVPLQALAQIIPATHYLQIVRGVILKGVGLAELWQPLLILAGEGLLLLGLSIRKFKVKL